MAGVSLSALIFSRLRKRMHVALAEGSAVMILLLSLYPLVRWMSESPRHSFINYALLCFAAAVAAALALFILQKRS
jgi:hypothetical protein